MDLSALLPILSVIIAGGGVGIYLAKSHKESLNVTATKAAVETISESMSNLRTDNASLRTEVNDARAETNDARAEVKALRIEFEAHAVQHERELAVALALVKECRTRIAAQNDAIVALGGTIDESDETEDIADG